MARIRRLAVLVGVAALAGAVITGPAQADSPEVFSGSAAGSALDISVLGKQATFGVSAAQANSTGAAEARGIGQATSTVDAIDAVVGTYGSDKTATATAGTAETKAKSCQPSDLEDELPDFINVGVVCSAAAASGKDGAPSASAEGSVADASLDADVVVTSLPDTGVIGDTLAGVLDPLCTTLAAACPATTTVKDLVESVLKTQTLDIELGKSTSSVTTTAGAVTSDATAAGAVIKILPLPQVDGLPATEPVVTITIGDAKATATYDRKTGKATPSVDPALVRIEFNSALTDSLELTEIVLRPSDLLNLNEVLGNLPAESQPAIRACDDGLAICILNGPLESRIYLASGSAKVGDDGRATAVADAVRVDLLMGLTDLIADNGGAELVGDASLPGVRLALAHAEAGVGGQPLQVTPTTAAPEELPRGEVPLELPRTGGGLPVVPFLGTGLMGLAFFLRRAITQAGR